MSAVYARPVGERARDRWFAFTVAYGVALATLALAFAAAAATKYRVGFFTQDPIAALNGPIYAGFVSSVGVLLWWTGAVACLLAAIRLRRTRAFVPLLAAGTFTAWLALDDLFQIHEEGITAATGLSEKVVYVAYGLLFLLFLRLFRPLLDRGRLIVLGVAAFFFAISIAADLPHREYHAVEDSAKLLGIATWTVLLVLTSYEEESRALRPAEAAA